MLHLIVTYGPIGLFVGLALEYFVLVVPGETILTTVGIATRSGSIHLNMVLLIVVTGLGTFAGAMIAYFVGKWFGRPLLERYGRYVLLTPKRLEQSEAVFRRYTWWTLIVSRYIAVVRDIVPYIAGINRTPLAVFIPITFVTSFLWTATFLLLGGLIGQTWALVRAHWRVDLIPAVMLLAVVIVAYRLIHRRMNRWLEQSATSSRPNDSVDADPPSM